MDRPGLEWVEIRGWTKPRVSVVGVCLLAGTGFSVYVLVLRDLGPGQTALSLALIWALAIVVGIAALVDFEIPRLGLSNELVVLKRWVTTLEVPWTSIQPFMLRKLAFGGLMIEYRALRSRLTRQAMLTIDQGRALLRHPAAPTWHPF